jgi:hypothetical protein
MKLVSLIVSALMTIAGIQAQAATGTGKAKIKVVNGIVITKVSDLEFNEAAPGAPEETVAADATETAQNASFTIQGEPNRSISLSLPQDGMVNMTGPGDQIAVNQFTSNNPTQIEAGGTSALYVGATRAALSATQTAGDYEGDFTVDVVYQ